MSGLRRVLRLVLLAAVLILLGGYLVRHRAEVVASLSNLTWGVFLLLCGLEVVNSLLSGYRLYLVAREHGERVDLAGAVRLFLVGRFLNTFLPQSGNLYRGLRFKSRFGVGYARYVGVLAGFTWLSVVTTVALALVVLALPGPAPPGADPREAVAWLLGLLLGVPVAAVAATRIATRHRRLGPLAERARGLLDGLRESLARPRLLIPFLATSLVSFGISVAYFGATFHSLGLAPGPASVAVLVTLVRVGSLVNLTPGNLGVLEAASGALVDWLGFSAADGVLVVAVGRAVGLVVVIGLALVAGWRDVLDTLASALGGQGRDR